jgi:hypothetical protein
MSAAAKFGLLLSGAATGLDLLSGSSLIVGGGTMMPGGETLDALGLLALGALMAATGVLMAGSRGREKAGTFGLLMTGYGIIMGVVPLLVSVMNPTIADGMRVVGALMIVDGAIMFFSRMPML